jgi:hypothetical protein
MIIWGGSNASNEFFTGARFNPVTNTWTAINTTGSPLPRQNHIALWTGSQMLITGGDNRLINLEATGAIYNPQTNLWSPMAPIPTGVIPTLDEEAPTSKLLAIWTGQQMVIFGGTDANGTTAADFCLRYFPQAQTLNTFIESNRTIWLYQKE